MHIESGAPILLGNGQFKNQAERVSQTEIKRAKTTNVRLSDLDDSELKFLNICGSA